MRRLHVAAVLLLGVALLLPLGCSDDDDPTTPPADTTGPRVLSTAPVRDALGVPVGADILITFDEAVAEASLAGNVALSEGTITDLSVSGGSSVRIQHSDFAAGSEVTVTVGPGITDTAGNAMDEAYELRFWTQTSEVLLLTSEPADGASDVSLNAVVRMLFSVPMDLSTTAAATTVDALLPLKVPLAFEMSAGDGSWLELRFDENLPANSSITVSISTEATSQGGANLSQAVSIGFSTGDTADTTPPQLVSLDPPSGSTIAPGTSTLRMIFDEAIDPENFEPAYLSAQLAWAVEAAGAQPSWSVDGTELTVRLFTPLPAGMPLSARFDSFADLAGNVNTSGFDYELAVAGQADWYPFQDGLRFVFASHWMEKDPAEPEPFESWDTTYEGLENVGGGDWHRLHYDNSTMSTASDWDVYGRTPSQVIFKGFHETDEGTPFDADIDPDVVWLYLPPTARTWSGTSSVTFPEGTATVDYTATLVRMEDVPFYETEAPVTAPSLLGKRRQTEVAWEDCWLWTLDRDLSALGEVFSTGTDSIWYAPGVGVVQRRSYEEESDGWWNREESYLQFIMPPGFDPFLRR